MGHKQVPAFAFADDIAHWQNIANDRRLSLGQFITECVEDVYGGKPESWRVTYKREGSSGSVATYKTLEEALKGIIGCNDKYTIERLDGEGNPVYRETTLNSWKDVDWVIRHNAGLTVKPGPQPVQSAIREPLYQVRYKFKSGWSGWSGGIAFTDAADLVSYWSTSTRVEQVEIRIKPTEDK